MFVFTFHMSISPNVFASTVQFFCGFSEGAQIDVRFAGSIL